MLPKDLTEDIIKRLSYIKGQIGGIEKMFNDGKEPNQIINQFKAAEAALNKAHFLLLDEVFRKGLAILVGRSNERMPGELSGSRKDRIFKEEVSSTGIGRINRQNERS